ncbi:hypothetical protein JCM10207_000053 [Rhodosporidiobolus poonsookiae]
MRSVLALISAASLAGLAAAQSGYGRFPCTIVNGDGTFSADQTQCTNLLATGANIPRDQVDADVYQGDTASPVGAQCVRETESGAYFCGIAGATCTVDTQCDNGHCVSGRCQGGFGQDCAVTDANCSGYLYCLSAESARTPRNTCGGIGAFCQDYLAGDAALTAAQNQDIFNQFCSSSYCNAGTGNCDNHMMGGQDCSVDPEFGCATGFTCNADFVCVASPVTPSQAARSRSRRDGLHRRNLCPASHTACSVDDGKKGFECIDVTSNLEQCGACASQGGVDCTALPGVESVGCVAGQCEIWSCAEGYAWDSASQSCVA